MSDAPRFFKLPPSKEALEWSAILLRIHNGQLNEVNVVCGSHLSASNLTKALVEMGFSVITNDRNVKVTKGGGIVEPISQ